MVIKKGSFEEEIGMPTQPGKKITIDNDEIAKKILRQEQNLPAPGWDWKEMSLLKKVLVAAFIFAVFGIVVAFSLPAGTRDNVANAIFAKTTTDGMDGTGPSGGAGNPPIIGTTTPTPAPVKNKTGNPSGATTPTPTTEKEPVKADEIALEYVTVSENSKISETKLNIVYISPPASNKPKYQGTLMIKKEDLPKISSLTVGATVLNNFRTKATANDWGVIEADIANKQQQQPTFIVSIGALIDTKINQENLIYAGTGVIYGAGSPSPFFEYPIKDWSKAKIFYITINSP